jgi:hypothetical protein
MHESLKKRGVKSSGRAAFEHIWPFYRHKLPDFQNRNESTIFKHRMQQDEMYVLSKDIKIEV